MRPQKYTSAPTAQGVDLAIGARLKYRSSRPTATPWEWDWTEFEGTVVGIESTETGISATVRADDGQQHRAYFHQTWRGELQLCLGCSYSAQIITPALRQVEITA